MARRNRRGLATLLFIFCCHAVGFLLFCKGFLLKRVVIPEYSNCTNLQHSLPLSENNKNIPSCYSFPRPFNRAVWLLVDALRYDFVLFNESLTDPVPIYRNKLPFIRDLLRDNPSSTRLFKFVADPPTTTMQRLKALTTGSLPTFIDVGSNFNTYAVSEDSLPRQFRGNGRNVTFIGDDTWLGLYPDGMLTKAFDYPSLNVQDLDTVDDGVMKHLEPELALKDADIVIGHMLGVDHIGHTYGPSHWTIEKKLTQVNNYVRHVITESMDEDTILFIFGDHGMTPTGDHGGETNLETDAALIVYSKRLLFNPSEPSVGRVVDQVDIVPTTALVLGLPIPFSNLGTLIPDVLLPYRKPEKGDKQKSRDDRRGGGGGGGGAKEESGIEDSTSEVVYGGRVTLDFLNALKANAEQLHTYLVTYAQYSGDFPAEDFAALEKKFNSVVEEHQRLLDGLRGEKGTMHLSQQRLTEVAGDYISYTKSVKRMCAQVWAKFDDTPIRQGLFLLAVSVVVSTVMLLDVHEATSIIRLSLPVGLAVGAIFGVILLSVTGIEFSLLGLLVALLNVAFACLLTVLAVFLLKFRSAVSRALFLLLDRLCRVPQGLLGVLQKLNVVQVLAVSLVAIHSLCMFSNSFVLYEADMLAFFIQTLVTCLAIRALHIDFTNSSKSKESGLSLTTILVSLAPYLTLMVCVRLSKAFYSCRDLQLQDGCYSTSFLQGLASAGDSLGSLAHWRLAASCLAVAAVPLGFVLLLRWTGVRSLLSKRLALLCEVGLALCVVCVVVHWNLQALPRSSRLALNPWQLTAPPLMAYFVVTVVIVAAILWPFQAKDFRVEGSRHRTKIGESEGKVDIEADDTWNVATGVSTTVGLIEVSLWVPLAMLLNDGISLSAFLTIVEILCVLYISRKLGQGGMLEVSILWIFLGAHSFFSFGHHATVTSLRFEAAFVGIHGEITKYNLLLAGLLVGLNTMASQILFGLGLPLLVLLKRQSHKAHNLSNQLLPLLLSYSVLHSWKLVTSVAAASMHRRHLMVWLVFAPRCLYEGAFQFVTDMAVILGLTLISRLQKLLPSLEV